MRVRAGARHSVLQPRAHIERALRQHCGSAANHGSAAYCVYSLSEARFLYDSAAASPRRHPLSRHPPPLSRASTWVRACTRLSSGSTSSATSSAWPAPPSASSSTSTCPHSSSTVAQHAYKRVRPDAALCARGGVAARHTPSGFLGFSCWLGRPLSLRRLLAAPRAQLSRRGPKARLQRGRETPS